VFFALASRSLRRRLLGERQAISLFPASCAFLNIVSAFAVSHKVQPSFACRAVAMGRKRGRRPAGCCGRGVRFGTCGAASGTALISKLRKSGAKSITSFAADLNVLPRLAETDATST